MWKYRTTSRISCLNNAIFPKLANIPICLHINTDLIQNVNKTMEWFLTAQISSINAFKRIINNSKTFVHTVYLSWNVPTKVHIEIMKVRRNHGVTIYLNGF